ncbi:MAG: uracil-DNA glycosylase [Ignavibacteria bacterium]|nr:uracil-DNA glycosylase [Ignavibacteria bacterium]
MTKELSKIIEDSINHLKFVKEYRPGKLNFNLPDLKIEVPEKPVVADKPKHVTKVVSKSELFREDWMDAESMPDLENLIKNCSKCALSKSRNNFVFGSGNLDADIVVVGEAPGSEEDLQGKPFVGRAGKLLTDILAAVDLNREDVFICNILKCRPPGNRNPQPDEILKCRHYLDKQLCLIHPKIILALGAFAAQTLLDTKEPLGKLRGQIFDYSVDGNLIKVIVTYHPAALLRNPNWKRPAWEDMKLFQKFYSELK